MCQHLVVVFKAQKTLPVKTYSNGCQNVPYEWLLGSGINCWQYLGKSEIKEAGFGPHALFTPIQGGYFLQNLWFDWDKEAAGQDWAVIAPESICTSALNWWLCLDNQDEDSQPSSPEVPDYKDPSFQHPGTAFVTAAFSSPPSLNPLGLEKLHTVCRHGLSWNSPFIPCCNNLLVPLTFAVNGELGHYQGLVRMKGNTSPQLWKYQHLLYFSCYLWPGTYNWSHSWDRNHMQREMNFNPLLAHHSWVLTVCANVRGINASLSGNVT